MELVDGRQLVGTKVSQLEQATLDSEKFELVATFEQTVGELITVKISKNSVGSEYEGRRIGYPGHLARAGLLNVLQPLLHQTNLKMLKALTVKDPKGKLQPKNLRTLAIEACAEAAKVPCPAEADVGRDVQNLKTKSNEVRDAVLAELRGGPEGVALFAKRTKNEFLGLKNMREQDLSNLDLKLLNMVNCDVEDFSNSSFENSNLTGAQVRHRNFKSCNFKNAILNNGKFQGTNFSDADFSNASLIGAELSSTSLNRANLENANLAGSLLTEADLRGANLSGADLSNVRFYDTSYDAATCWPRDYCPPPDRNAGNSRAKPQLVFKGEGRDPFIMQQVKVMAANDASGTLSFDSFLERLDLEFDQERLKKSIKMLKAERFQLFAEVSPESLVGVVKSQTDAELVYSCRITDNGAYACCTQNLNSCGGLRGALCKHLLVLLIGITKSGELEPSRACEMVLGSKNFKSASLDKEVMTATLLRYKSAEAGEIDWRPTETLPEDYYAY